MPVVLPDPPEPDPPVLRRAVEQAGRAPSVHNSQPWRWGIGPDGADLFLDRDPAATADERDLLLSCGAALHHLLVALAGLGRSARVERFPDPADPAHLARVRPVDGAPSPGAVRLAAAIARRHTDRRRLGSRPVDRAALDVLARAAAGWGAELHLVGPGPARRRLVELLTRSAGLQQQDAAYAAELARWSGPAAADPAAARRTPHSVEHVDASVLAVLSARTGDRLGTLRAGEAAGAVLLVATDLGLASTALSRPLEPDRTRASLGREFTGPQLFPQLVLRFGWPRPGSADLPPTPRRDPRPSAT